MEKVLATYDLPYNPEYPVICLDERPCQLIGDTVEPIAPAPGRNKRIDYHYQRNGTCAITLAIEPLTGKRIVQITERRRKQEYTDFMELVKKEYPLAKKIIVIQDNLNTHSDSSFYASRCPENAFELMKNFEMIYTPRKASWLNMVEIELAAMSKQCLDRRISSIEEMKNEVEFWTNERARKEVKITWQFTKEIARDKLSRHYKAMQNF